MSIEGIANYQHLNYRIRRPEWQLLERYDYCDQDIHQNHPYWTRFVGFLKSLVG